MYCNSKLKDEVFQRLSKELEENELLGGMDIKQLKSTLLSVLISYTWIV